MIDRENEAAEREASGRVDGYQGVSESRHFWVRSCPGLASKPGCSKLATVVLSMTHVEEASSPLTRGTVADKQWPMGGGNNPSGDPCCLQVWIGCCGGQ